MRPTNYSNFTEVLQHMKALLQHNSHVVHPDHWQGLDISKRPEMATHELSHVSFQVDVARVMGTGLTRTRPALQVLADDIKPNLPWADNHFNERVCGAPINPGAEWANWPGAKSAATFLDELGKFNHNYMERYWPKLAGIPRAGPPIKTAVDWQNWMTDQDPKGKLLGHHGITYEYGDLDDVVQMLAADPYTRQAYLPVWFPEDTGGGNKRAPCTIGYHFLMRDDKLDITYQIRSCDFTRHLRDDIYLTVRLALWVMYQCREIDKRWEDVTLGKFTMHISSLHIFRNDYISLFGKPAE